MQSHRCKGFRRLAICTPLEAQMLALAGRAGPTLSLLDRGQAFTGPATPMAMSVRLRNGAPLRPAMLRILGWGMWLDQLEIRPGIVPVIHSADGGAWASAAYLAIAADRALRAGERPAAAAAEALGALAATGAHAPPDPAMTATADAILELRGALLREDPAARGPGLAASA